MNIGLIISEERTKANLSRKKLATLAGCTERAIIYWENGTRSISLENADKIFRALGKPLTIGAKNHEQ